MTSRDALQRLINALKSPITGTALAIVSIVASYLAVTYGTLYLTLTVVLVVAIFLIWLLVISKMQTLPTTHWEVKNSLHIWEITAQDGSIATVNKTILAKCLADDISVWDEIIYGSDTNLSDGEYKTSNGEILRTLNEPEGKTILVKLNRNYNKGDLIEYKSSRVLKNAFTPTQVWVSVYFNGKVVGPLQMEVIFPDGKNIDGKVVLEEKIGLAKKIISLPDDVVSSDQNGRNKIKYKNDKPKSEGIYVLRWTWQK